MGTGLKVSRYYIQGESLVSIYKFLCRQEDINILDVELDTVYCITVTGLKVSRYYRMNLWSQNKKYLCKQGHIETY